MKVYIIKDKDSSGGHFGVSVDRPILEHFPRKAIIEIRYCDVPDEIIDKMPYGLLPIDEDGSNDSTWAKYWDGGQVVWTINDIEAALDARPTMW